MILWYNIYALMCELNIDKNNEVDIEYNNNYGKVFDPI